MNESEQQRRIPRTVVLLVADFRLEMEEARSLRQLGARVAAAGLGGEAERRALAEAGIDPDGVSDAREAVLEAALDRLGAADVVLFGAGDWTAERPEIFEAEREQAIADGRSLRAIVQAAAGQAELPATAAGRAAFALALGAGASREEAMRFAGRGQSKGKRIGHKNEDHRSGGGGRSRTASPRKRKSR